MNTARRGALATALLDITVLMCLFGPRATASAAAPQFSAQAMLARLALQVELSAVDGASGDTFGTSVALAVTLLGVALLCMKVTTGGGASSAKSFRVKR